MHSRATAHPHVPERRQFEVIQGSPGWFTRGKAIALVVAIAVIVALLILLYSKIWPYSEASVMQDLAEAADSTVTIQSFHKTYFPPGCVIYGMEFFHGPKHFKLLTIQKMVVKGSYIGILRRHVSRIVAIGAKVFIPPFGSNTTFSTTHSTTVVDEIIANGSFVEFETSVRGQKPLRFDVHDATLKNVQWSKPIVYQLKFHNPEPPGELSVSGKFGSWTKGQPGNTPFSGDYMLTGADLGVYGGIAGVLSSQGKFDGTLQRVAISGTTDTPDFEVISGGHKFRLDTKFDAYVDATHGDTFLKRVEAHFGHTTLLVEGSVAGMKGRKGKIADLHLTSQRGRIEDILGPFISEPRSPMSGETSLRAHAQIPPGNEPFLKKVNLQAVFGIDQGNFTKSETQQNVNELSAGARGESKEDPETVVTDLTGQVDLAGGVAHFTNLRFSVPGVKARMNGTFNVINEKIDLHGRMRVETRISKTASGFKAFVLKMIDPIFKKKKKGEVVPVHIGGTYEKPEYGLDLGQQNQAQQNQGRPNQNLPRK